jgi:hypothetical protein
MYHVVLSVIICWFLWSQAKTEIKTFSWNNIVAMKKFSALDRITLWFNPIECILFLTADYLIIMSNWIDFYFLKILMIISH